jgi:DNA-binding MarR family transcriptional regulator
MENMEENEVRTPAKYIFSTGRIIHEMIIRIQVRCLAAACEKGILIRERSREDRRKVVVHISPEAVEDINRVETAILKTFEDIVRSIGLENSRKWFEVLERVKGVIEKK